MSPRSGYFLKDSIGVKNIHILHILHFRGQAWPRAITPRPLFKKWSSWNLLKVPGSMAAIRFTDLSDSFASQNGQKRNSRGRKRTVSLYIFLHHQIHLDDAATVLNTLAIGPSWFLQKSMPFFIFNFLVNAGHQCWSVCWYTIEET